MSTNLSQFQAKSKRASPQNANVIGVRTKQPIYRSEQPFLPRKQINSNKLNQIQQKRPQMKQNQIFQTESTNFNKKNELSATQ